MADLTPKVIAILKAMHPRYSNWFYTRELARLAHVSVSVVSSEFSRLVGHGIIKQRQEGREKYYALDISNPKTRALCELFESERREELYKNNRRLSWASEELSRRVIDHLPQVQSLVLFGSAARGEMTKTSDVDILVLVPDLPQESFSQLMKDIDKTAMLIAATHPVHLAPITMTVKDFESALREKRRIAEDALRDGIVLLGGDRYLRLLSKVI